jgi:quercetin dioxygenase-like cupin family protein
MKRGKFVLTALAAYPMTLIARSFQSAMTGVIKGFKVNSGESRTGRHLKMKAVTLNVLDVKISSKDSGGEIAVFEQTGFTAKGGPPLHKHLYQDEFFYIVEGDYFFQVGKDTYFLKPGDTIFLPRNIQHAFIQLKERGRVIVSYIPAGTMERFFETTDSWTSPPAPGAIKKVFEDNGMQIVGPPLKIEEPNH